MLLTNELYTILGVADITPQFLCFLRSLFAEGVLTAKELATDKVLSSQSTSKNKEETHK